jgi:hypothetical protein
VINFGQLLTLEIIGPGILKTTDIHNRELITTSRSKEDIPDESNEYNQEDCIRKSPIPYFAPRKEPDVTSRSEEDIPDKANVFYQLDRIGKHPTPYFAPRKELEHIDKELRRPVTVPANRRILSLVGLGGSGKTQLMLQYAWTHRYSYGVVLWFDAQSRNALDDSFLLAARQMGLVLPPNSAQASSSENAVTRYQSRLESNVVLIKKELRRRRQQWLLLYDGADDLSIIDSLPQYFPYDSEGAIIISSR